MLAVTTFHPEGYAQYGRRALETLSQYFPGRVVAYVEEPVDEGGPKVEYRDLYAIPQINEFLELIKRVAGADGQSHEGYDYRYDANRFCRKVFVQDAVFDEDENVFWFDSDCVLRSPVPEALLAGLLEDVALAYLGRNGKQTYTETGFIGFNTKHERFAEFRSEYLPYFTSGRIFEQLKGWHDCIAFDHARQGIPGNNLSPSGMGSQNVITQTVLANYMHHYKGNRKEQIR